MWPLSRAVRADPGLRELFESPDDRFIWDRLTREARLRGTKNLKVFAAASAALVFVFGLLLAVEMIKRGMVA